MCYVAQNYDVHWKDQSFTKDVVKTWESLMICNGIYDFYPTCVFSIPNRINKTHWINIIFMYITNHGEILYTHEYIFVSQLDSSGQFVWFIWYR